MQLRSLGRRDLQVSRLGLGLSALGRPGYFTLGHREDLRGEYDVDVMRRRAFDVMDAAYEAGVRYFDAARSYGRAEDFLGDWLRTRTPEDVTTGSKWGYVYVADWRTDVWPQEVKDHSADNFERQWTQTRERLGDRLGVYMIHSVTPDSNVLNDATLLARLENLAARGVLVGLSVSGPKQGDLIRRALELDVFRVVQATWNLLEPSADEALREAHAAGLGVIVKEGVANGRLTERGEEAKHPAMRAACQAYGVTPDVIALAAVLAQPFTDVVLSGAATVPHLRSNLRAADLTLDEATLDALKALTIEPTAFWKARSAMPWT
ncbi:aldo/keto reductase [Deinococcus yavapaiensis]|uniref:Aryl-alcohol dehydrogenase-like predicted oxidoreductase n=1 Tax=Deinococcus yavapaiensis KR-236 TaxID=694435 RepID=A0A318S615_9DEIO|nr:aldo/keto reductase [Deinococcus yavapaiensis]PYE54103.1 aryl-alcohol dehydrogenase-like predicted oxidoreductase [Deinococcus yavapaiensis KR-236]